MTLRRSVMLTAGSCCFIQEWAWTDIEASARNEQGSCLYQAPISVSSPDALTADPRLILPSRQPISSDDVSWDERGVATMPTNAQTLIEKIRALPEERLNEVEDYVNFLRSRYSSAH
jgi:hypothetical protein